MVEQEWFRQWRLSALVYELDTLHAALLAWGTMGSAIHLTTCNCCLEVGQLGICGQYHKPKDSWEFLHQQPLIGCLSPFGLVWTFTVVTQIHLCHLDFAGGRQLSTHHHWYLLACQECKSWAVSCLHSDRCRQSCYWQQTIAPIAGFSLVQIWHRYCARSLDEKVQVLSQPVSRSFLPVAMGFQWKHWIKLCFRYPLQGWADGNALSLASQEPKHSHGSHHLSTWIIWWTLDIGQSCFGFESQVILSLFLHGDIAQC